MTTQMTLLLGSNLGNRQENLARARSEIEVVLGRIERTSSIYESEAVGFAASTKFLNQALIVRTALPPFDCIEEILRLEWKMGRRRNGHPSSRIIDIDIVFYGRMDIQSDQLTIPHPRMHERRFALEPLAEIAPDLLHPRLNKTVMELLNVLPDTSEVSVFSGS